MLRIYCRVPVHSAVIAVDKDRTTLLKTPVLGSFQE